MAYSDFVVALRQCTQQTRAGQPCRQFAIWGDELGRCRSHGGVVPFERRLAHQYRDGGYAAPAVCRCDAYAWPHRPAGGLCQWPHGPMRRSTTKLGTRSWRHTHRRASRRYRRWDRMLRSTRFL